jgi:hypothetical protein
MRRVHPTTLVLRSVASLILLLAGFSVSASAGTTIHVPADQSTIQAGINAAVTGDTVLVSAGTYYENINFNGKAITVTSANGPAVTIIDGSKNFTSVVTFSTNETESSVLSGFTVQSGYIEDIYVGNAAPTIKGNVIVGISPSYPYTVGVRIQSGSGLIQGNLIVSSTFQNVLGSSDSGLQIIGNVIAYSGQAGVELDGSSGADVIQQNAILGNTGPGLAIYYPAATNSTTAVQNLITANRGAGVWWVQTAGTYSLVSNTISDNQPACCGNTTSEVELYPIDGSTLQNNLIIADGAWSAFDCTSSLGPKQFTNNGVFSSGGSAYTSQCPDPTGTNGNLSVDPLFADSLSQNFHLQSLSPVRATGAASAAGEPKADFDGDPRIVNGKIDIGADEYKSLSAQTVSSYSLHFPAQDVGTVSAPQTVTLTNNRKNAMTISLIASSPSFSQTNNCGVTVAAAASCQISVIFSPLLGGVINGVLGLFTSATLNPEAITLLGTGLAPQIQIGCCFYFSGQVIGSTNTITQNITNTGQAPLIINSIVYGGPTDFVETNNCPIAPNSLAVGASCALTVSYTPTVVGLESGTITVTSNAGNPQSVLLSGSSVSAGNPVLSPPSLTFPSTLIGQTSASQTLTLTNTGTGTLGITSIYSYGDFPQTNNCPTSLAVGASCTFTVTYTAGVQGTEYGSLYVYTDSAIYAATASFTGTGTAPAPTITSLSVTNAPAGAADTFIVMTGTGFVNTTQVLWNGSPLTYCCISILGSTQIYLTIPASDLLTAGTNQISVSTPAPGGGTSNAIPFPVFTPFNYAVEPAPYNYRGIVGTNLNMSAGYAAVITSPFPIQYGGGSYTTLSVGSSGTVSFSYFANQFNSTIPVSLTTTLVAPFWTDLYPFGTGNNNNVFWEVVGSAPNRQLVIEWRNVGICCETTNTVKFEAVFFEGNGNVLFNYADTVFGGSYSNNDNGATATVGLQVTPTVANQFSFDQASVSSKTAQLWYPNNPTATVSTSSVAFGYHQVGTSTLAQALTLTNGGLVPLTISSIATNTPDFTETNTCGTTLASNQSCSIHVFFKPSQPITETATLTITDNATNSPQTVSLTGTGTVTSIVAYPTLVNFGGVTVGTVGTAPVTLANASNASLTIQQITASPSVYTATNNCGTSLAPGMSCTVTVNFTPTQKGSVQGKLFMALNGKAATMESSLTGAGQ